MINVLHIYKPAFCYVEIDSCAQHFLYEHWNIEIVGIETGYIAVYKDSRYVPCYLFERRTILYVFIVYSVDSRRLLRNVTLRVYTQSLGFFISVGEDFYVAYFHNPVVYGIYASRLEVEEKYRLIACFYIILLSL